MPSGYLLLITTSSLPAHGIMKSVRILVPIDTTKCRPEVFSRVNGLASRPGVTVTLLHVLNLNIVALENRIYEELGETARWHLERLAKEYVRPGVSVRIRIRAGNPVEEILAEAKADNADLIILPSSGRSDWKYSKPSFWKRLFTMVFPGIGERLIRVSDWPLLVVHAATCFNCQERWGHRVNDLCAALKYLEVTSEVRSPSTRTAEDSQIETGQSHRLAA
jgi:nucleotide-binding universal stress UspA family protein